MLLRPPRSTRTDTLFPYTTLFRSLLFVFFASLSVSAQCSLTEPAVELNHVSPNGGNCTVNLNLSFTIDKNNRSEEHTSELQSLMRISYAVFCTKKKSHQY